MNEHRETKAISPNSYSALSELEWRIVEMARVDGPRSLNTDGFWALLARMLFGIAVARGLANEGLEALRRFCVRAWHWDLIRTSDMAALIDGGYSRRDARQILAHVASYRGFMPPVQDDLLNIGPGLEGSRAPSRRSSGPALALPAPQAPLLAPRRGQSTQIQGKPSCIAGATQVRPLSRSMPASATSTPNAT
jgi:hypothetical protein